VFNARSAFQSLNGQEFTYHELRKRLDEIRAENMLDLPAEFGTSELFGMAEHHNWIRQTSDKLLTIAVEDDVPPLVPLQRVKAVGK
jgi:hypothetical protein